MGECIFGPHILDAQTKPEHVLHDAFGGRKTTRQVVCSGCNNTFGGGIDKVFAASYRRRLVPLDSSGDEYRDVGVGDCASKGGDETDAELVAVVGPRCHNLAVTVVGRSQINVYFPRCAGQDIQRRGWVRTSRASSGREQRTVIAKNSKGYM
jgi:hypothetical protein